MRIHAKRQLLKYYGSKWEMAEFIISFFASHTTYIEPYFGGGNVFFKKTPSKLEIVNDKSHMVTNFFFVLREKRDELLLAIELTPYSRREIELANRTMKTEIEWEWSDAEGRWVPQGNISDVELARRFYVRARQGRTGNTSAWNTTWRCDYKGNRSKTFVQEWVDNEHIYWYSSRLKLAQIEGKPALEILTRYDTPETLWYLDPPYPHSTRGKRWGNAYAHEMSKNDHAQLLLAIRDLKGMCIISSYHNEIYHKILRDWHIEEFETKDSQHQDKTEVIWINPRLWERYQAEKADKVEQNALF